MKRIATVGLVAVLGIAATSLPVTAMAAPAHVATSNGWGWGQLDFSGFPQWQSDAVRDALVAAAVSGVTESRRAALAPLVASKVLTQAQADLIASVPNASVIAALVKAGEITKAQAVLVRKALAGSNGIGAKRAAAKIALDNLVASKVITQEQADAIKGQLGL
jgi:hypothetical protein